ncbi:diacylglycerol kinase family protein [Aerococcaceae bacterium 50-4]
MGKKGYLFIFNQAAGKRKKADMNALILDRAAKLGLAKEDIFLVYSTSKTSSQFLIDRFAENYQEGIVVACGGDGTVHTIGNLVIGTKFTFAILPLGTGNDFYGGLYGKRSVKEQIDHIFNGTTADTDAIYIPELDLYVINILSVGLDANVVFQANNFKEKNKIFQKYAYMASIPKALQGGTAFDIELTARLAGINQEIAPSPYIIATLCNGIMYGGGFKVNPTGQINDGLLELVYAQTISKSRIFSLLYKFFSGQHENVKELHRVICDEVIYQSKNNSPMVINCDGEIYELPYFTCQVKKHAYKQIV